MAARAGRECAPCEEQDVASIAQHRDSRFDNSCDVRDASTPNGDSDASACPLIDVLPRRLRPNKEFDIFDPFAREFLTELVQFQGPHARILQ